MLIGITKVGVDHLNVAISIYVEDTHRVVKVVMIDIIKINTGDTIIEVTIVVEIEIDNEMTTEIEEGGIAVIVTSRISNINQKNKRYQSQLYN